MRAAAQRYSLDHQARMFPLLVTAKPRSGRRVGIAAGGLGHTPVVSVTVSGPGASAESLLKTRFRTAGATVTIPKHLAPGRYVLAITDYSGTRKANGKAQVFATEFTVK